MNKMLLPFFIVSMLLLNIGLVSASVSWESDNFGLKVVVSNPGVPVTKWHNESFGLKVTVEEPPAPSIRWVSSSFGLKVDVEGWSDWSDWWKICRVALEPQNLSAKGINNTVVNLTWDKGEGANNTYIVRKMGSLPINRSDGANIYNGTGSSYNDTGLQMATLYYYRAWSWNSSVGFSVLTSNDSAYTAPDIPTGFQNTSIDVLSISFSWTKGTNASRTVIRYNDSSYPANPQSGSDGYNDTGSSCTVSGLEALTTYYFRVWSWVNPFSESNVSMICTTEGVFPDPPYNGSSIYNTTDNSLHLRWTRGNRSDKDKVLKKTGSYSSSPTDGAEVQFTDSLFYNESGVYAGAYYSVWSYNDSNGTYSLTSLQIPWGALGVSVFNESSPHVALSNWNIQIKNRDGSQVYTAYNQNNTVYLSFDAIPFGNNTLIRIWKSGYRERDYYHDLLRNTFHNFSFYLPPVSVPSDDGGDDGDGELEFHVDYKSVVNSSVDLVFNLTYTPEEIVGVSVYSIEYDLRLKTDSVSVSDPDVNATIVFSRIPDELIGVYVYNDSIYGGWILVPDDKYVANDTHAEVDHSVMDDNTSMVKAEYYYYVQTFGAWESVPSDSYDISGKQVTVNNSVLDDETTMVKVEYYTREGVTLETELYYIRVENEYGVPVEDAKVHFQRYISTTDKFENVSVLLSDANGYVNLYLIPLQLYQVVITADSYEREISDYIPDAPDDFGQVPEKVFRLKFTVIPIVIEETLWTNVIWSIEPTSFYYNTNITLYFNISSSDNKLVWFRANLYWFNNTNISWDLLNSSNVSNSSGGSISFTTPNWTGKYSFVCSFKKQNYSMYIFGPEDGCRFYYIFTAVLPEAVLDIPADIYLFITVIIMFMVTAFLIKIGAGAMSGLGGLAVMGFMFAMRPDLSYSGVSVWFIFLATAIAYFFLMFIKGRI